MREIKTQENKDTIAEICKIIVFTIIVNIIGYLLVDFTNIDKDFMLMGIGFITGAYYSKKFLWKIKNIITRVKGDINNLL